MGQNIHLVLVVGPWQHRSTLVEALLEAGGRPRVSLFISHPFLLPTAVLYQSSELEA